MLQLANPHIPYSLFLDIDGTILYHHNELTELFTRRPALQNVHKRLQEWTAKGYKIILMTGRPEHMRKMTEEHLAMERIYYDMLIMGVGTGSRIIVNDSKAHSDLPTAHAITVPRDKGFADIDI